MPLLDMMSLGFMPGMQNSLRNTMMQQRAMHYMSPTYNMGRMQMPRQAASPRGNPFFSGLDPEAMGFEQLSQSPQGMAAASHLLSPLGLSPLNPRDASPYALLPNSGFFGRHQRLGSALEGAMFGGANVAPSQTVGEGISNALRGAIMGTQQRRSAVAEQYAAPYRAAQVMLPMLREQKEEDIRNQQLELRARQLDLSQQNADIMGLYRAGELANQTDRLARQQELDNLRADLSKKSLEERQQHDIATEQNQLLRAQNALAARSQRESPGHLQAEAIQWIESGKPDLVAKGKNRLAIMGGAAQAIKEPSASTSRVDAAMLDPVKSTKARYEILRANPGKYRNMQDIPDNVVRDHLTTQVGGSEGWKNLMGGSPAPTFAQWKQGR